MQRILAAASSMLVLAACGSASSSDSEVVVRDSAGIRIIENPERGAWEEGEGWTLTEAVTIGELDGPPEYTFNRIADLAASPSGRIYVLDSGDLLVKAYDSTGTHLFSFGGEGEGPDRFQGPTQLALRGDTVVVYDYELLKLALFTAEGELIRTVPTELSVFEYGFPRRIDPLPQGYAAVLGIGCSLPPPEDRRPMWKLMTLGLDGTIQDTIAILANRATLALYGERFCSAISALAAREHNLAVTPDGLAAYGTGDRYEIRIFRLPPQRPPTGIETVASAPPVADGSQSVLGELPTGVRFIRRAVRPLELTAAEIEAYRARHTSPDESDPVDRDRVAAIEAAWDSTGFPATWPAFDDLHWDPRGYLWVGRAVPADASTRPWDIFDRDGVFLGSVPLPADLAVEVVGDDVVWGTVRDELDVQYVKGYRITTSTS